LTTEKKIKDKDIVIYGTSVGSGPSTYLAHKHPDIPCLILEAPFTAITRVKVNTFFARIFEMFDNINLIGNVNAQLMIVHGEQDTIIPFEHGKELYMNAKNKYRFINVPSADHNNILSVHRKFISHDVATFISETMSKNSTL